MIRFGPAGNSDAFYEQGYKSTCQAPKWLSEMGLNAFEYSFGRGVRLSEKAGKEIASNADMYGVAISIHAPYYINLAGEGEEKYQKNLMYFRQCADASVYLNAKRIVFHPGACANMNREEAFARVCDNLARIISDLKDLGHDNVILCPETMGKINQIANLEEVAVLCNLHDRIYPTIDFAHLHARDIGGINSYEDYRAIIDYLYNNIGSEKTGNMHVHFSRIQYTQAGEKMHRTFAETEFGPDYEPLCRLFFERRMTPTVICESRGTQAIDAKAMLDSYNSNKTSLNL